MLTAMIAAMFGLLGVVLGGGVRAWEAKKARRADADALLSALVAEVEAITRLVNHRQFIPGLQKCHEEAQQQVLAGHGDQPADFMVMDLKHNYFTVYDSAVGKLGLLNPYFADRIVRFYIYVKAAQEDYRPDSVFQSGITAQQVVEVVESDLQLLQTAVGLGLHIMTFRPIAAPKGFVDPFAMDQPVLTQPLLPPEQPLQPVDGGKTPR